MEKSEPKPRTVCGAHQCPFDFESIKGKKFCFRHKQGKGVGRTEPIKRHGEIKKCTICSTTFRAMNNRQITCGDYECKQERNKLNIRSKYVKKGERFGEACPNAKLTEKAVRDIRDGYKKRKRKYGYITEQANKYGVSPATIQFAILRRTWKHVS